MILSKDTRNKINEYLIKKLGMFDYKRGWLKGDCPDCGKALKFGVNLYKDKSNCFSCGYNPRPIQLIKDIEGFSENYEVYKLLGNLEGITYAHQEAEAYQLKENTVLPDGYRNLLRGKSILAKSARAFVKRRGFDVNKMALKGWGYGTKDKYQGYLIMPIYQENRLVYFNARLYCGYGPKFNNPPIDDFGLGKSFIIYNIEALYTYKTVWIVESITNAETIGDNASAMSGKALSAYQINEIIKSPCEKLIIALDRDALDWSIDLAFKLIDYKRIKILVMPENKDINDLGRNKSLEISHKSKYLKSYNELMKFKNEYL